MNTLHAAHCLFVGMPKYGTSSLFKYVSQHPMVVSPRRKELHYLKKSVVGNYSEYLKLLLGRNVESEFEYVTIDATPAYS